MEGSPGNGLCAVGERLLTGEWSKVKATDKYVETHPFPETGKGQAMYLSDLDNFLLSDYKGNFT